LIYESGVCDGKTMHVPMSVCDHRAANQCSTIGGLVDTFGFFLQSGFVTLGFLGGASVDKYGGVNVTSIGDYYKPNHRFTGSGGNGDIGTMAKRVVYIILQEKRRFLERNDYTTTPGWWCWDFKTNEWKPKKEVWKIHHSRKVDRQPSLPTWVSIASTIRARYTSNPSSPA